MSAVDFVVRDAAGSLQHGSVGGGGITSQLIVGSGADVSLNLARNQIQSYAQEGGGSVTQDSAPTWRDGAAGKRL